MKVLFLGAEVAPFVTVGGLSQVMYFLPKALANLGHEVRVLTPKYGTLDEKRYPLSVVYKGLRVPTGEREGTTELVCNIKASRKGARDPQMIFL